MNNELFNDISIIINSEIQKIDKYIKSKRRKSTDKTKLQGYICPVTKFSKIIKDSTDIIADIKIDAAITWSENVLFSKDIYDKIQESLIKHKINQIVYILPRKTLQKYPRKQGMYFGYVEEKRIKIN